MTTNYFELSKRHGSFGAIREGGLPKVIVAADIPYGKGQDKVPPKTTLEPILDGIRDSEHVVGVKIGTITTARDFSIREVVDGIHDRGKLAIYDMQKLGKDVPVFVGQQAANFASVADVVIVDPKTGEHWNEAYDAIKDAGKGMITVLYMTDEKGTYNLGQRIGTTIEIAKSVKESDRSLDSVVLPANQLDVTRLFLHTLAFYSIEPMVNGPGIGKQGGDPNDAAQAGIDVGIAGRLITGAEDKVQAAEELYLQMNEGYQARKVV